LTADWDWIAVVTENGSGTDVLEGIDINLSFFVFNSLAQ
jgi:hypothetical protein